jgi:hypothetical protein
MSFLLKKKGIIPTEKIFFLPSHKAAFTAETFLGKLGVSLRCCSGDATLICAPLRKLVRSQYQRQNGPLPGNTQIMES